MLIETKCDQELFNSLAEEVDFKDSLLMLLKAYGYKFDEEYEAIKQIGQFIDEAEGYL